MKRMYYFNEDSRLEPPEPPELHQEDDFTETIELELDAVVTVDKDGYWEYEDKTYSWARCPLDKRGDWYTEEHDIYIGHPTDIVEAVDYLIETSMPAIPGKYKISGQIELLYNVSGVEAKYDYFVDEDDLVDYNKEVYTDDAEVELDLHNSSVSNFKFRKLN